MVLPGSYCLVGPGRLALRQVEPTEAPRRLLAHGFNHAFPMRREELRANESSPCVDAGGLRQFYGGRQHGFVAVVGQGQQGLVGGHDLQVARRPQPVALRSGRIA